jgi:DNA-binding CsgD family transcriptional regulator
MTRGSRRDLHGRSGELSSLRAVVAQAAAGRFSAAIVEGEAGIGKTRIVEELAEEARGDGFRVFLGRAEELDRARPFGVLVDAVECDSRSEDPRRSSIATLIAGGGAEEPADPGLQFRVVDALVGLVEEEALDGPVALMLEDVHWADPSTIVALRALSRRLAYVPVGLVCTLRPLPRGSGLAALIDALEREEVPRIVLGPLGGDAVATLVGDLVQAEPGPVLMDEVATAAGNPFFITELVRALELEDGIQRVSGRAELVHATLPRDLRLAVLRSIGFLGEETLEVLRVASVLGSSFRVGELATTMGRSAVELAGVLEDALRAGVLEGAPESSLRFRHDLIRDAVYLDMPDSLRAALHGESGQRLAAAGAPALRVAEQLRRGDGQGDPQTVEWLVRAAREAAPGSPSVAADLLGDALQLAAPTEPERDSLAVERGVSLFWAGRVTEAEAVLRESLVGGCEPSLQAAARSALAQALTAQGRVEDALDEVEAVSSSTSLPAATRASSEAWVGHMRMMVGQLDEARAVAEAAARSAVAAGDYPAAATALCCVAHVKEFRGQFTDALTDAEQALTFARQAPSQQGFRFHVPIFAANIYLDLDRVDEALTSLQEGVRIAEDIGARWTVPMYHVGLNFGHYLAGSWDDAITEYEAALEFAEESGTRMGLVWNHSLRAMIALHRNDLDAARAVLELAEREVDETGPQYRFYWMHWARALLLEASGETDEAFATLSSAWDLCVEMGMAYEFPQIGPDMVRLALAVDNRNRAGEVAAVVDEIASRENVSWLTAASLRCRGARGGDSAWVLAEVDACRATPRLLDRALALEEMGAGLAAADKAADAQGLLEEALGDYESLDATRDVARVDEALRALGVRRGRRGSRRRPESGWESLTESEHRVVALAAEGLTNRRIAERLFISPRTVQTHLSHVFGKLEIASRTELAALVAARAPSDARVMARSMARGGAGHDTPEGPAGRLG